MASFLGSMNIFRTPKSTVSKPRERSSGDDLSPESVLSSPISASALVKNGQPSSLKKLKRKRMSTDASHSPEAQRETTPELKAVEVSPAARKTGPEIDSIDVETHGSNAVGQPSLQSSEAVEAEAQDDAEASDEGTWTIEAITGFRWVDEAIELRVKWDTGDSTWEPEISLQEDVPTVLFSYWASQGGRPPHPSDPELFHIFAVRQVRPRGKQVLVEWVGCKERSWEPRSTVEEAAPELLKDYEARHARASKRRRKN